MRVDTNDEVYLNVYMKLYYRLLPSKTGSGILKNYVHRTTCKCRYHFSVSQPCCLGLLLGTIAFLLDDTKGAISV